MYETSFDTKDSFVKITDDFRIAFRIHGEYSMYVPHEAQVIHSSNNQSGQVIADRIRNVGTHEIYESHVCLSWELDINRIASLRLTANLPEPCRSVVYLIDGIAPTTIEYVHIDGKRHVSNHGFVSRQIRPINYPRFTKMPLWFLTSEKESQQFFVLWRTDKLESVSLGSFFHSRLNSQVLAVSYHARRNQISNQVITPCVNIGPCLDRDSVVLQRLKDLEDASILVPYDQRRDKPAWLDDVQIAVYLHGEHWLGHIHNSFEDMISALESLRSEIVGQQALCILLGWDGPYYRAGLNLYPSVKLGGVDSFCRLQKTIQSLGGHLIVFSPLSSLDRDTVLQKNWQEGVLKRPWGAEAWLDWVDWDCDLENEPSCFMNLGYDPFREFLLAKYDRIITEFNIDGIYFDITNYWDDDPNYDYFLGVQSLISSLRANHSDLLLCAENWYDHLLGMYPLFAEPGNEMGHGDLLLRYCRSASYIACPSPLGSGGVHEKGRNYLGHHTLKSNNLPYIAITEDWRDCLPLLKQKVIEAAKWEPRSNSVPSHIFREQILP